MRLIKFVTIENYTPAIRPEGWEAARVPIWINADKVVQVHPERGITSSTDRGTAKSTRILFGNDGWAVVPYPVEEVVRMLEDPAGR